MQEEASLFKALSDPIRLRLAALLAINGETCVCMLTQALKEPQFKISKHLAVMRAARMVEARREGTWMHYKLAKPRFALERCIQDCLRDCLKDDSEMKMAIKRFANAECEAPSEPKKPRRKKA